MASLIKSRRSRVIVLTIWALIVCAVFFRFHKTQNGQQGAKFSKVVDEKTLLEPETNKKAQNPAHGVAPIQDLTNSPDEPFNPRTEYKEILSMGPVVVFSKSYCPHSQRVKRILAAYNIVPEIQVVELDLHPHGPDLQAHIGDVTGRRTVPNVHVKGISRGGGDDFAALHDSDMLEETMRQWSEGSFQIKKIPAPHGGAPA